MCCHDVPGLLVVDDATMLQTLLEYVHAYQHLLPPRRRPWRIDYTALIDGLLSGAIYQAAGAPLASHVLSVQAAS